MGVGEMENNNGQSNNNADPNDFAYSLHLALIEFDRCLLLHHLIASANSHSMWNVLLQLLCWYFLLCVYSF
jgi:hypothetical protein